jgi:hypothetical protein
MHRTDSWLVGLESSADIFLDTGLIWDASYYAGVKNSTSLPADRSRSLPHPVVLVVTGESTVRLLHASS